jgi:predicted acylesterase/phospholipase RssA/CRP-like cAMP-binding protein
VDDVFVILGGSVEVLGFDDQPLAVLEEGSVVGEIAVLAGGSRTATVRSIDSTEVASLDAASFERLVSVSPDLYERVSTEAIRRLDHRWLMEFITWLLGPVDPQVGDAIAEVVTWHRIPAGDYVYREGEPAASGFTVIRGRIRITGPNSLTSEPHRYEVGKGALIGEYGLVAEDAKRNESALAVRDSVVVEVPRAVFLTLIETYPKVVASVLANLIRQQTDRKRSDRESTIAVLSLDGDSSDPTHRRLGKELEAFGRVSWVSSERADDLLGKPGVAQSEMGTPGDARLSQLLNDLEQESTYLLYQADPDPSQWSRRIMRQAEIVVVAVAADATSADIEALDELVAIPSLGRSILAVFHPSGTPRPHETARLVARWDPDLVVHVEESGERGINRLARILADRASGLVLGGGGARGFAHLGVWRALKEQGVDIDLIGGASMGAAIGAVIARGGEIDEMELEVQAAFRGLLDYTIPLVSLVKGKRVSRRLREVLGDWDIEDLWMPYFCTSTNLTQSQVVVHDRGNLARAVRASVAIPGVLPPVASESDLLVDAGVLNNLPADVMRGRIPNGTIIAVNVAAPVGPRSPHDLGMSISATQVLRSRLRPGGKQYPRLVPVLVRSMITGSARERDRNIDAGIIDFYLDLDMEGISLLDFNKAAKVVKAGYEAAAPRIEAWLQQTET